LGVSVSAVKNDKSRSTGCLEDRSVLYTASTSTLTHEASRSSGRGRILEGIATVASETSSKPVAAALATCAGEAFRGQPMDLDPLQCDHRDDDAPNLGLEVCEESDV
jgi:hypothetical protein